MHFLQEIFCGLFHSTNFLVQGYINLGSWVTQAPSIVCMVVLWILWCFMDFWKFCGYLCYCCQTERKCGFPTVCYYYSTENVVFAKDVYFLEISYDRKFKTCWVHGPCFHFVCPVDAWISWEVLIHESKMKK